MSVDFFFFPRHSSTRTATVIVIIISPTFLSDPFQLLKRLPQQLDHSPRILDQRLVRGQRKLHLPCEREEPEARAQVARLRDEHDDVRHCESSERSGSLSHGGGPFDVADHDGALFRESLFFLCVWKGTQGTRKREKKVNKTFNSSPSKKKKKSR